MMLDLILIIITSLLSINVVGIANQNGYLNGGFSRAFAGIGGQITSSTYLIQYTNFETFIIGCSKGYVGLAGYAFLASLVLLIVIWVNNLIEYRQAIM